MSASQTRIEPASVESPRPKVRIVVPTTPVQRREAYRLYQATGDWQAACRQTRMVPRTFWYWMKRAAEEGAAALDAYQSCAHHAHLYEIAPEILAEVRQGHAAHPEWGKRHLAQEVRKAHAWQPVIGPTKVGELLRQWRAAEAETAAAVSPQPPTPEGGPEAASPQPIVQHADRPGKTYNIDLFFVPEEHISGAPVMAQAPTLAAASDSTGQPATSLPDERTVEAVGSAATVLRQAQDDSSEPGVPPAATAQANAVAPQVGPTTPTTAPTETAVSGAVATPPNSAPLAAAGRTYPGQAFQAGRDYNTNMAEYAHRRQAQLAPPPKPAPAPAPKEQALAEAQRQLKHAVLQLRFQRATLRQQRQQEDATHRAARQSHDQHQAEWRQLTPDAQAVRQAED